MIICLNALVQACMAIISLSKLPALMKEWLKINQPYTNLKTNLSQYPLHP
jgi:hypothetical protein